MNPWFIPLVLLLVIIAYQDIRERQISVFVLLGISVLTVVYALEQRSFFNISIDFLINIAIVGTQFAALYLILKIRKKDLQFKDLFSRYIGIGDLVFFIITALLFPPFIYILSFTLGLIWSLIAWKISVTIGITKANTVPLAGLLAIFYSLLLIVDEIFLGENITNLDLLQWISIS